ncbi:ABC transporter ATP-binding protein [Devosia sp. J2-20]|jgi:branched-chain amino acid transport system ATP-binding protein|uniref:ABC transporter ATP-binding protein n=1 Tax=Devosia litorisediminis TaxID=2829817 RepID=A0A942E7A0_9HYPH|nr:MULTISPECIES: ABC transporter ATP-binding protein [Devosia]MBS3848762.1 ABC transporter ATP-binding protein [Devosia litorisediminis]MCZ4346254.1 ABC transporter ATP-binding protein [Devosia neptuniae]WDQ98149.1 ABC transporter ATP-binding protein [Devosia sp. J2-20]|tara:strand:- start:3691 stop:4416 length:726 start_codon:yes stop_codon:yes gene_type:complete
MLDIANLSLRYGRHLALDDVSVSVGDQETVVILGANGAGKSSLLKAVSGMVKTSGQTAMSLDGLSLLNMPPHKVPDAGIALVPEGRGIFGELTVDENLMLGAHPQRARGGEAARLELIFDLFPKLAERRKQMARTMSGGEQQMVAIGRALMSNPRLLMLDEPSLGLAPIVVTELFAALRRIRETGVALLLVEQNVSISLAIADRGYLMEAGRIVGENTASALMTDPAVQQAFLGGTTTDLS